mgnify:CR=1 FL=1
MALVNKVDKRAKVEIGEAVKFQILTYCFFNDIQISMSDLNCLYLLAMEGNIEMTKFCNLVSEGGIFKSPQSCRNALSKAEKKGLIIKNGNNKKTIELNSAMNVQIDGPLFLEYKILGVESETL